MKISPFGGANEIGASSTLIEIDDYRILVDAGIRMGPGQEPDPDFPNFYKESMPHAVLLTHAHADHTGALPVLHSLLSSDIKVYCTRATKAITEVSLRDSVKRMQREEKEKGKTPRYTADEVQGSLNRMEQVSWLKPVEICPGIKATWIPAGHILGAAMIYIQGKQESILMTGDVSSTDQLTIPGLDMENLPYQPDVMGIETTYANRRHKNRKKQVGLLLSDVANTIEGDGKVLFPVFAIGRFQEVILILKHAMERKQIPELPVYIGGKMVQKINKIYRDFADELLPPLQRKARLDEVLFYPDNTKSVSSRAECKSISEGPPCYVVTSSGMLIQDTLSYNFAKRLVSDPKNLIALTGFQAKGTPGGELWDCVEKGRPSDWMWQLKDQGSVVGKCQVEKYSLSAHADSNQLLELVEKVQPRKLFLVHGDDKARKKLRKSVRKKFPTIDVKLPKNSKSYTVRKYDGIAKGRQLWHDRILSELSDYLHMKRWKKAFSVQELTEIWFGSDAVTPIAISFFQLCLWLDFRFFKCNSDDLYYLRQSV